MALRGALLPAQENGVVFAARVLTKSCRMGDVEVRALRGVDLDQYPGELGA